MKQRILLVEDESNVGSTLSEQLEANGYELDWAKMGAEAKRHLETQKYALALLDVGLPDMTGFDIAEEIRRTNPETAVVFLTAFGNPEDRIRGLELGAEDYIVKPFHLKELMLRIQNVLRRAESIGTGETTSGEIQIGQAKVNFAKFTAVRDEQSHALTHKECALLQMLFEKHGEAVSRNEILDKIWKDEEFPTTRTVDNFILKLRKLIEPTPEKPQHIKSIRGVGYQLFLDLEQEKE